MWSVPENRRITGAAFFVTCDLAPRRPIFAEEKNAKIVVNTLKFLRVHGDISLYSYVVMPDHIHFVARMADNVTVSSVVRRLKTFVAKEISLGTIWNKGFWTEAVSNGEMLNQKIRYIHSNPVRAGLASDELGYRYSSAKQIFEGNFDIVEPLEGYPCTPLIRQAPDLLKTAGGRR